MPHQWEVNGVLYDTQEEALEAVRKLTEQGAERILFHPVKVVEVPHDD